HFSLTSHRPHRHLPSFPTRRSSDLFALRRRLRFLMRDLGAELFLDVLQAFPRDRVPAVVVDRSGSEQTDSHLRRGRSRRGGARRDRKSTSLNSSHMAISYAVFCLKK